MLIFKDINPGFYVSIATMAYPTVFENTDEYNASTSDPTHSNVTLRNALIFKDSTA